MARCILRSSRLAVLGNLDRSGLSSTGMSLRHARKETQCGCCQCTACGVVSRGVTWRGMTRRGVTWHGGYDTTYHLT
jgi:hypothetical protein